MRYLKWLLAIGLLVGLFFYFRKVDFSEVRDSLKEGRVDLMLFSFFGLIGLFLCRIDILRSLLELKRPIAWRILSRIYMTGAMVDQIVPARGGTLVRWTLLNPYYPHQKGFVFTALAGSMVIEGFSLLILFVVSNFLSAEFTLQTPKIFQIFVWSILIGITLFLLISSKIETLIPERFFKKFTPLKAIFEIRNALNWARLFRWSTVSVLAWLFQIFFVIFLARAFAFDLDIRQALTLLLFVNFAVFVPITPTNLGTIHFVVVACLTQFHISKSQALAYAIAYHSIQSLPLILFGLILYAFGPKKSPLLSPK